jgi:hypothetical protein
MNLRYQASFQNYPDLMITVSLTNVLMLKVNRKLDFSNSNIKKSNNLRIKNLLKYDREREIIQYKF